MHLKARTCFLASILLLAVFLAGLFAQINPATAKSNPKYASIVMDADTGLILHQRYANKKLHPASLTKVMTLLMVFEALEQGRLRLNDRIVISKHAESMVPSKLGLKRGSTIRVKDAIYALVTKSANDIAVALAERIGGTESNFARLMTKRARNMGMTRTNFRNASGLHHPRQISTARDMAKLARTVINEYPGYYHYFSRSSFNYRGKTYRNHNRLMKTYKGMDGMKTGYVNASGFNLMASAVRNNQRLIGIVFGGRTAKSRNAHMASLLDRGFAKMGEIRVASSKVPLPPRKPGILVALNSLQKITPTAGEKGTDNAQRWALLNPALKNDMFSQLIGEGDYDPDVRKRLETGLMAIAAHKGEKFQGLNLGRPAKKPSKATGPWSIQIGAFKSRAITDRAIQNSLKNLPREYAQANPVIAPLKTNTGWVFRGRLSGYTKSEAKNACQYLDDCLPVAPAR